jgi:polyphosphate kinase
MAGKKKQKDTPEAAEEAGLSKKQYEKELAQLHAELVKLQ